MFVMNEYYRAFEWLQKTLCMCFNTKNAYIYILFIIIIIYRHVIELDYVEIHA